MTHCHITHFCFCALLLLSIFYFIASVLCDLFPFQFPPLRLSFTVEVFALPIRTSFSSLSEKQTFPRDEETDVSPSISAAFAVVILLCSFASLPSALYTALSRSVFSVDGTLNRPSAAVIHRGRFCFANSHFFFVFVGETKVSEGRGNFCLSFMQLLSPRSCRLPHDAEIHSYCCV